MIPVLVQHQQADLIKADNNQIPVEPEYVTKTAITNFFCQTLRVCMNAFWPVKHHTDLPVPDQQSHKRISLHLCLDW